MGSPSVDGVDEDEESVARHAAIAKPSKLNKKSRLRKASEAVALKLIILQSSNISPSLSLISQVLSFFSVLDVSEVLHFKI